MLLAEDAAAAEDPDEYLAENVFWVPKEAPLVAPLSQRQTAHNRQADRRCDGGDRHSRSCIRVLPRWLRRFGRKARWRILYSALSGPGVGRRCWSRTQTFINAAAASQMKRLSNEIVGSQHQSSVGLGLLFEKLTRCSLLNYFTQPHKLIYALT